MLSEILTDPRWHDYLAVLKGARNGLVYGAKIRFPHALVMTFLFRPGTYLSAIIIVDFAKRLSLY